MILRRRLVGGLLGSAFTGVMAPGTVGAQRPPALRRIGYLQTDQGTPGGFYDVLRDGLRELGHLEGRSLVIERRSGELAELPARGPRSDVRDFVLPARTAGYALLALGAGCRVAPVGGG